MKKRCYHVHSRGVSWCQEELRLYTCVWHLQSHEWKHYCGAYWGSTKSPQGIFLHLQRLGSWKPHNLGSLAARFLNVNLYLIMGRTQEVWGRSEIKSKAIFLPFTLSRKLRKMLFFFCNRILMVLFQLSECWEVVQSSMAAMALAFNFLKILLKYS